MAAREKRGSFVNPETRRKVAATTSLRRVLILLPKFSPRRNGRGWRGARREKFTAFGTGPEVQPRLLSACTWTVSSSFPFPLALSLSLSPSPSRLLASQSRNSPLSCCGRSARVSHVARGWIYKGALRRRRPYWCSRYSRARSRTTASSVHMDRWRILSRVCVRKLRVARTCVRASFPQQAYRRLPTTPTADVANNGAINATGMWKSSDVLHADNGNAWQLERRETGRAAPGRTLNGSMRFFPGRATAFLLEQIRFCHNLTLMIYGKK